MIHVKALKTGFYGHRRRLEGQVFQIADETHFSARWMKKVDPKKGKAPKQKQVEPEEDLDSDEI